MIIHCQDHYDKVVEYANSIQDTTLSACIERLKRWEQNPDRPCTIHLSKDFAPYSFGFSQHYPDGSVGIVGGLLYHGRSDQSHAVTLEAIHGWSTHT
ncbi:MAG: DUF4120 family protein [Rikenellaceae bacterium]